MKLVRALLIAGVLATSVASPAMANPGFSEVSYVAAESTPGQGTAGIQGGTNVTPRPAINMGESNSSVTTIVNELYDSTGYEFLEYDSATGTLYFNIVEYNALDASERRAYMKEALPYIGDSSLDKMYKNRMYNFVAKQDTATTKIIDELDNATKSNLSDAAMIVAPIQNPVSVIMGLITILVFAFLGFSAAVDLFFIAIPISRGVLLRRTKKDGTETDKGYFLASPEAVYSVRVEEESGGERSALGCYIKKRTAKIIAVGILMIWFMQGEILHLLVFILEALRPLWESFIL